MAMINPDTVKPGDKVVTSNRYDKHLRPGAVGSVHIVSGVRPRHSISGGVVLLLDDLDSSYGYEWFDEPEALSELDQLKVQNAELLAANERLDAARIDLDEKLRVATHALSVAEMQRDERQPVAVWDKAWSFLTPRDRAYIHGFQAGLNHPKEA